MSQQKPIRISGHRPGIYVALLWCVRVMLIFPIILPLLIEPANGQKIEPQVIAIVAIPWLLFETWRLITWLRTLWLIDTDTGFIIQSRFRRDEYDDDNVLMTSLSFRFIQPQISSETYQRRTYHLWLRQRKITMLSLVKQAVEHDPLLPFIVRIEGKQLQKAKVELESGGEIAGADRWTLTETILTVKDHPMGEQTYSISELVAAKCCVDDIAVWSRDAVTPILNVPTSSPNAPLLLAILAQKLASQTSSAPEGHANDTLGRQIFVSRRKQKCGIHLFFIAFIAWFCFIQRANPDIVMVIGFFSLFYLIVGLLPAVARLLSPRFEIHENGVVRQSWFGKKTIFFNKMLSFVYTEDVMYYNDILCTSKVVLRIQWQDDIGRTRCTIWRCRGRNLSHEFAEYDFFAEELTGIFVGKMWDELHASGFVHWNDSIQITADGVHLASTKGKTKKLETVFVPFDQLRCKIDETGTVFGANEIGVFVPKGTWNYHPGIQFVHEVATAYSPEYVEAKKSEPRFNVCLLRRETKIVENGKF